jgi:hypothetical protein
MKEKSVCLSLSMYNPCLYGASGGLRSLVDHNQGSASLQILPLKFVPNYGSIVTRRLSNNYCTEDRNDCLEDGNSIAPNKNRWSCVLSRYPPPPGKSESGLMYEEERLDWQRNAFQTNAKMAIDARAKG